MRATVWGKDYLQTWSNVFDVVIAVASFNCLFIAAPSAGSDEKKQDAELSQSLVMLRIIVQFSRILFIAEHAQRMRKALTDNPLGSPLEAIDLDFGSLKENSRVDMDGL